MNGNRTWRLGGALALAVVAGLVIAATVSAQPAPPTAPNASVCAGPAMMGGAFGPYSGGTHEAIASALGMSSQELWTAQPAGKSIATLAQERTSISAR